MKYYVKERGLEGQYYIDSAGISGYHSGDPADRRMQSHAIRRGYDLTSLSRKFYPDADFSDFDMISASVFPTGIVFQILIMVGIPDSN